MYGTMNIKSLSLPSVLLGVTCNNSKIIGYLLSEETRIEPRTHHHINSSDRHIMFQRLCKTVITFNTQMDMQYQYSNNDMAFITNTTEL